MPVSVHALTPTLTAHDPRGLVVRSVGYYRSIPGAGAERRVNHNRFDTAGHCVARRGPRLWALLEIDGDTPASLALVHSLSGQQVSRDSVDAGFACSLSGEARQSVLVQDGKGNRREFEYDELLRLVAIHEEGPQHPRTCSERFIYANGHADHALGNACGRLQRHDDPAGTIVVTGYALTGEVTSDTRRFCSGSFWPDWPVALADRDALLAPDQAQSGWVYGPVGQVLEQTDAAGNRRFLTETLAGHLREVRLQLANGDLGRVLHAVSYNAFGQVEAEAFGNGAQTLREYCPADGRLLRLCSQRAHGEALQDLRYHYDPAGNALSIEDKAQPLRHFAGQRIEPRCDYRYDSFHQLIEATGWEAGAVGRGPQAQPDPQAVGNYRQSYVYDHDGNLLDLVHAGPQAHGRTLKADQHSNRCLPNGEAFADSFDANGNLLRLQPGQTLHWDVRNQLREVRPVTRDGAADDTERYVYDGGGQRVRKVGSTEAANRTLVREVRYLPGLERHERAGERLDVIMVQAGTCSVRVLHWQAGRPDEVPQDQLRYALTDHLGSCSLELDGEAALISHEVFHPFGSTAWWAGRDAIEAGYKTVRYSGKERDATGLYYYGARYYRTDWQRWLNPDPAGEVDGLNLYCMVRNNPLSNIDPDGRSAEDARARWKKAFDFHRRPIASVAPGIVRVHLSGGRELFEAAGFPVADDFPARRTLTWLSIDSNYNGKIVGVERTLISIQTITARQFNAIANTGDADYMAFINGGFFNGARLASSSLPQSSPIGDAVINGQPVASVPIPDGYEDDYAMLSMSDSSSIHTGPVLASGGTAVFTPEHLEQPRFVFSARRHTPGKLSHANQRNPRSAISQPESPEDVHGRTRLVVGVSKGRGPRSNGYTMVEWAGAMARIDRLNSNPGRSVNLDGGSSSLLGVVNRANELLLRFGSYCSSKRTVGNFIAYARRS